MSTNFINLYTQCNTCNLYVFHTDIKFGMCPACFKKNPNTFQNQFQNQWWVSNTPVIPKAEPMQPINITWNPDIEAYETSFPYNKLFIDWIKSNIPTNDRSMDFDRNRNPQYKWLFKQETMEKVILPVMKAMFAGHKFIIVDKKKVDDYNQGFKQSIKIDTDGMKQEFRLLVSEAGISLELPDRKQYLRAAMYYHPDRNPANASKMSRLNEIWNTVFEPKVVELKDEVKEPVSA